VSDALRSTRVLLENTHLYIWCHDDQSCRGEYCTLHNRSDHHMRGMPQSWRGDRGIIERICEHGIGHPDPDEIMPNGVHGCDGCCMPEGWVSKVEK
jgi:hypothetical protein